MQAKKRTEFTEAVYRNSPTTRHKVTDLFTRDEIRLLTKRSDLMGAWAVFVAWGGTIAIFAGMVFASKGPWWLATLAIIAGMALLGGRQLALSILVHDAAHGTLFKTKWLNARLTNWFCAKPLWSNMDKYRAYHFIHHTKTGTDDDPDLILSHGLPTTAASMRRKFRRDLLGVSGVKYLIGRVLMDLELMAWTVTGEVKWLPREGKRWHNYAANLVRNITPMLVTNVILAGALYAAGHLWLYACWVGAHLTFFMLYMRIRSMAEHAATERTLDMFENTRTVRAGPIARMLVAPIGVNYHMEHHILASCPYFNLKKAHQLLVERGGVPKPPTYWQMLKIMTTPVAQSTAQA